MVLLNQSRTENLQCTRDNNGRGNNGSWDRYIQFWRMESRWVSGHWLGRVEKNKSHLPAGGDTKKHAGFPKGISKNVRNELQVSLKAGVDQGGYPIDCGMPISQPLLPSDCPSWQMAEHRLAGVSLSHVAPGPGKSKGKELGTTSGFHWKSAW